ncbi:glycosyl transferase family 1 [Adhaeribacter swui]|uniref:Glycosyl transferase family 1 n=1 Tax=Adhaeribacter swui TaxID=2086471 RepID=A0A7G7G9I1_9BACT|nr:glycosyl transferase family 1 [Adhaeribacter swui]QNF33815.1 glycosyl transferase family 1 [Adhaeribacter swui]
MSNILLISPEPWGANFVSKHHYALELVKRGNIVFYLNPPSKGLGKKVFVQQLNDCSNLKIVDYTPIFRGLNKLPAGLSSFLMKLDITRILKVLNVDLDIVWSFDPFRFQKLNLFLSKFKIYHSVDVHHTTKEYLIAKNADVIFSTAHKILNKFSEIKLPKYFVNHGLASHFIDNKSLIKYSLVGDQLVKVGYVGNLNYKYLDKERLYKIISENLNCGFYFIGPRYSNNLSNAEINKEFFNQLEVLPNVYFLGQIPSKELPHYLCLFDMFLMCYKGDENIASMANPHKLLEYFSTGKIVLSHYIDEYARYKDLLVMADNNENLPILFSKVVTSLDYYNSLDLQHKRKAFAYDNTYAKQLDRIESIILKYIKL